MLFRKCLWGLVIIGILFWFFKAVDMSKPTNTILIPISIRELQTETRKGTSMVLYVSSDGCPFSRAFTPTLKQFLKDNKLQIYNLNFSQEKGSIDWEALKKTLGETASHIPRVYAILNGQPIDDLYKYGGTDKEGLKAFFQRYDRLSIYTD